MPRGELAPHIVRNADAILLLVPHVVRWHILRHFLGDLRLGNDLIGANDPPDVDYLTRATQAIDE
jgi:hypothetical protein